MAKNSSRKGEPIQRRFVRGPGSETSRGRVIITGILMNLFAYGSLLGPEGLRDLLGDRADTIPLRVARLAGWRRVWNVYLPDYEGAAINVEPSRGDTVVGLLVEGLSARELARLDTLEASYLPRQTVYVEPGSGEAVPAQLYRRRTGNHTGRPSGRQKAIVLERAYRAGWEVYENVCRGSVDAAGERLYFG
jgi:gamma-glutamylcyclotransferase (GGCT)/AIG2-like uncharacterized protein YtfP